jgi:hypothetical protein
VLDATAKIPSGISYANINWLGNYKLCKSVYKENIKIGPLKLDPLKGKYCRVVVKFPLQEIAVSLATFFQ